MKTLIRVEQNNEKLLEILFEHFEQLEGIYEGISASFQQFEQAIQCMPIEERAMLLMELSRQTIDSSDYHQERIKDLMEQLVNEPVSAFSSLLLDAIKENPLKTIRNLNIS